MTIDHAVRAHKALADPIRYRLFRLLAHYGADLCSCELVDAIQRPQYHVSKALGQLRDAGLVTERREGKLSFFSIANSPLAQQLGQQALWTFGEEQPQAAPNYDSSLPPGLEDQNYDLERLNWRLQLREKECVVVTYQKDKEQNNDKYSALFVCVHNSARSQMAQTYLTAFGGDYFEVESAGLTPGSLNPRVVQVMAEDGYDISGNKTQGVVDLYKAGRSYSYVITVCSREAEEGCPVFPGPVQRFNWPFDDPASFTGTEDEVLEQVRRVRDEIKSKIKGFVAEWKTKHSIAE